MSKASPNLQMRRNWIDRVVEYVSPVSAIRRQAARFSIEASGQWVGARTDRRETAGWLPWAGSADSDNLQDLPNIRRRTRDLQRNEPLANGAINTAVTKTIATGLSLRSVVDRDVLGMTADQASAWQMGAQSQFRLWAHNALMCDLRGDNNFYGQQELAFRSALDSGDVLTLLPFRNRFNFPYQLKTQLIEADRLCNKDGVADTEQLAGGVARDEDGLATEYHVLRQHPGGFYSRREWNVIPAFGKASGRRNAILLKRMLRPDQSRGMPYLAPVIEPLKQLGKYTNAELAAAVVSALFTVFIKTNGGGGLGIGGDGGPSTTAPKSGDSIRMGNAAIVELGQGEEIQIADPKRPNTAFDPFTLAILRQVGVCLELPFEVLVKHFTASYTAARAALLEAWAFIKKMRDWMGCGWCDPVYESWMWEAVLRGRVIAPGFTEDAALRAAYLGAEWIGDAPGLLDPLKEVQAARERIDGGLSNHSIETLGLMGTEWQTVHEQLADELAARREKKTMDTPPAAAAQPGAEPEPPSTPDKPEES
jgi:lambda family phage portal protein